MAFGQKLNVSDKILIYYYSLIKILRGLKIKLFLKKSVGLLFVGKKVILTHAKHITVGKNVKFEDYSGIHGLCSDGLLFGDSVTIGRGVMIRSSSYYGGDCGLELRIGNYSSIGPDGYVGCFGKIEIGSNVMFGPKCSLFAENHNLGKRSSTIKEQGVNQKGIIIQDDCWIGSNVIILDGVKIGKGLVIGAGTLIAKDVPEYSIVYDKRQRTESSR